MSKSPLKTDEPLYRKVMKGQRTTYEPVSQWVATDGFPQGAHLVIVNPGVRSTYFKIEPAYADLIAASKIALEAMTQRISEACKLRQQKTKATPAEQRAFDLYLKALPKNSDCRTLIGRFLSAHDVAQAGTDALLDAAKAKRARKPTA